MPRLDSSHCKSVGIILACLLVSYYSSIGIDDYHSLDFECGPDQSCDLVLDRIPGFFLFFIFFETGGQPGQRPGFLD